MGCLASCYLALRADSLTSCRLVETAGGERSLWLISNVSISPVSVCHGISAEVGTSVKQTARIRGLKTVRRGRKGRDRAGVSLMLTLLHTQQDACFQQPLPLKKTLNVLSLLRHKATVLSRHVITVVKTCPDPHVWVLLLTVASFSRNTSNYMCLSLDRSLY